MYNLIMRALIMISLAVVITLPPYCLTVPLIIMMYCTGDRPRDEIIRSE